MGQIVYILCALTSTLCAILLLRAFIKAKNRLLFWSMLCFVGLAFNNIGLYIDMVILPSGDFRVLRTLPALLGLSTLLFGLIQDTTE